MVFHHTQRTEPEVNQQNKRKQVLIVDDDQAIRESLRKVLEGADYKVAVARDGLEAEALFELRAIDLVLLDLNLPSQSGWDIFERFTTRHPTVPVIIITGMPNQYSTALAAGVGGLLEKPVEAPALLRTVDQLLSESEEERLRRMCGYEHDTKYLRSPQADEGRQRTKIRS